jgi:hypothetical protein
MRSIQFKFQEHSDTRLEADSLIFPDWHPSLFTYSLSIVLLHSATKYVVISASGSLIGNRRL